MERGKVKGKEGRVVEQVRAGSCAEQREHADHGVPWQWAAVGHLEVH